MPWTPKKGQRYTVSYIEESLGITQHGVKVIAYHLHFVGVPDAYSCQSFRKPRAAAQTRADEAFVADLNKRLHHEPVAAP